MEHIKTKKRKVGIIIRNIILVILSVAVLAFIFSYVSYKSWRRNLVTRLKAGSTMIETAVGPVEYAKMGKGPVILICHGGASGYDNIHMYEGLVDEGFTLICPSRPGYLRTPLEDGRSFEKQADMLAAFLDAVGIKEKVTVVTVSLGGATALQFALRHQDRLKALVMQDAVSMKYGACKKATSSFLGKIFLSGWALYMRDYLNWVEYISAKYWPAVMFEEFLQVESFYDNEKCREVARRLMKQPREREKLLSFIDMTSPMSLRMKGCDSEMEFAAKIPRLPLENIKVPVLVTHCIYDRDVPLEHGKFVADTVSNGELYAFDGPGHLFFFGENAPKVRAKLIEFLKENAR